MSASSAAANRDIKSVLETKPLKFQIKTGGAKYECQIHFDRASYDRVKTGRSSSVESINSTSTTESK